MDYKIVPIPEPNCNGLTWSVVRSDTEMAVMWGESYTVASNVAYFLNNPRYCDNLSECAEVARVIRSEAS